MPIYICAGSLPDEMKTLAGVNAAQSDGGDIRFTLDAAGTTQIACEIVIWTQDATPGNAIAEIWVGPVTISNSGNVPIYVWYHAGGGQTQPAAGAAYGSQAVWAGHRLVQHFGTPSVLSIADSTGNYTPSNSGTYAGPGYFGGMASFGTPNFLSETGGSFSAAVASSSFTISFVFATFSLAAQYLLGDHNSSGVGPSIELLINPNLIFAVHAPGTVQATPAVVATATWIHVTCVWDAGSTKVYLYVNGVATDSGVAGATALVNGAGNFTLGRPGDDNTFYLPGQMDEFRLSRSARSPSWIVTQYNNFTLPTFFVTVGTPGTAITSLFRHPLLNGISTGGRYFANPLG